jgi:DNA helicase-2/ATP-dependent DNA helicase PcrA
MNQSMNPKTRIPYQELLNPSQYEAVIFDDGPLLVIAGAGSGKTRTLTYRVARLVEDGVPPASILLLTFTRKASQEMLNRATELLDNRCERVSGGTFHSFANAALRRYAGLVDFDSRFTIIDRADMEGLISLLRKETGLGAGARSFPRKQTLAGIFSRAANKVLSVEDIVYDDYPHFEPYLEPITELHGAYQAYKASHNFMDYDDLLINLNRLLSEHPEARDKVSRNYQYIMVDEYQDTNQIQAEIMYLLAQKNHNIMVVGDDSQSIYAFRGAEIENILSFPQHFPDTTVIRLEENYRSVQPVLNLANAIIDNAMYKYTKTLFSRKKGDNLPVLVRAGSENSQSRFILDRIKDLSLQQVPLNQIAVLFRAGFHSFDLEIELGKHQVPFVKVGGFKFMESAHIKDVLAHLKVIHNADDEISWLRILTKLDKIGPKTAKNLITALEAEKNGFQGITNIDIRASLQTSMASLQTAFADIDPEAMSIAEMGENILSYYLPILEKTYDDHPRRAKDLEQLISIMDRYDHLETFLTDMAIEPPNTSLDQSFSMETSRGNRLTLSTIHSAKGLEWHTVFIIWALDGRFPSMHALNKEEDLEEERRLMYVATTRAKENLFITYPTQAYDRATAMMLNRPSSFLKDIPYDLLEIESVW